jgi:Arc/MetJ family transcription regulator
LQIQPEAHPAAWHISGAVAPESPANAGFQAFSSIGVWHGSRSNRRHEHAHQTSPFAEESPCQDMHQYGNMMHMRTTMILDDELIDEARRLTGLSEKTAIVHAGLEALIARESARRLANLGGSDVRATAPPRRRLAARRGR